MPRMPLPERRERLITAAIEVIGESGVTAATTRAITAKADMPLASFHYAFDSHSALMVEVIHHIYQADAQSALEGFAPATEAMGGGAKLPTAVELGLEAYVSAMVERPNRHNAIMQLNFWAMSTPGYESLAGASTKAAQAVVRHLLEQLVALTGRQFKAPMDVIAEHIVLITTGIEANYYYTRDAAKIRAAIPGMASGFAMYEAD